MWDTPNEEQHTWLTHDLSYTIINGAPVLDINPRVA